MNSETILVGLLVLISGILSYELGVSTAIILIVLGVISANFLEFHIIPGWLNFISSLGLLGIMFFAGTEVNIDILKRSFWRSVIISTLSFFLPFGVVYTIAVGILRISTFPALVTALSFSTTSISLIYCAIHYENKDASFYNSIIGSAVLVDIYGTLFLLWLFVGFDILLFSFFGLLMLVLIFAPTIWKLIERRYLNKEAEMEIRFIIILLVLLAYISSNVGAGDATLAFITGAIFSRTLGKKELVSEKLRGLIFGFLAPLFFFRAGLLIKFNVVTLEAVIILLILGSAAYVSKYLGVYLPSSRFFGKENAKKFSMYFNYRLSFAIIPAFLGLTKGLISEDIYTAIILFVILTAIVTSLLLRILPREV
ncbi:MAG: cation:proton antiporter [Candidatus Asgardarchaeia archaeon]